MNTLADDDDEIESLNILAGRLSTVSSLSSGSSSDLKDVHQEFQAPQQQQHEEEDDDDDEQQQQQQEDNINDREFGVGG